MWGWRYPRAEEDHMVNESMTAAKRRHVPPSRHRYETKNPVFSVRMPRELYEEFDEYLRKTGHSRQSFLKSALKNALSAFETYQQGRNEGYEQAKKSFVL